MEITAVDEYSLPDTAPCAPRHFMNEWSRPDFENRGDASADLVESLAKQALSEVVSKTRPDLTQDYGHSIQALTDAVLSIDPDARNVVIARLIEGGVTTDDFVTDYAPDVARHLGALWEDNDISFVDVTIGVARLQETVRVLSSHRTRTAHGPSRPKVMLIVPTEEDHVYGGLTAALAFEKLGCEVTFAVGHATTELVQSCHETHFDMVGISVSSRRNMRVARSLIGALRKASLQSIQIVIGGGLASADDLDLRTQTGADHVTSDPEVALERCGIRLGSGLSPDGGSH